MWNNKITPNNFRRELLAKQQNTTCLLLKGMPFETTKSHLLSFKGNDVKQKKKKKKKKKKKHQVLKGTTYETTT